MINIAIIGLLFVASTAQILLDIFILCLVFIIIGYISKSVLNPFFNFFSLKYLILQSQKKFGSKDVLINLLFLIFINWENNRLI